MTYNVLFFSFTVFFLIYCLSCWFVASFKSIFQQSLQVGKCKSLVGITGSARGMDSFVCMFDG